MSKKLGPHHKDALHEFRSWEVYRINMDQYAGDDASDDAAVKELFQKHLTAVRAVQACDIATGWVPEPGFYDQLRYSAAWAIGKLPEDYVEQKVRDEKLLDDANVIGVFHSN